MLRDKNSAGCHVCERRSPYIGVDLYTFVGVRAPTMLSWAPPPQGALGGAQLKLVLVSLLRFFDARAGAVTRTPANRPKCDHSIGSVA